MDTKIALIGTGGTIAGKGTSNTDLTGYTAGVLGLDKILASVPGTKPYGPYTYTQFSNIESSDITVNHWLEPDSSYRQANCYYWIYETRRCY